MFSIEIRLNSILIGHIYGRNIKTISFEPEICEYSYKYYKPEDSSVIEGKIKHERNKGIDSLTEKIFLDVQKKRRKNVGK